MNSFGAAYALGIPFGLSTCPVCTPMVLPMLGAAAATGEAWLGAALLFVFGLARGVPLLINGSATGAVKHLQRAAPLLARLSVRVPIVIGLVLIGLGLWSVYFGLFVDLADWT